MCKSELQQFAFVVGGLHFTYTKIVKQVLIFMAFVPFQVLWFLFLHSLCIDIFVSFFMNYLKGSTH
jgi:hypothetical protein